MRTEIFVQARMGSTRLPGKVLKPILGRPLLHYLLERLTRAKNADAIRVLTTQNIEDNAIESFCRERNFSVVRGSQEDVLARFQKAAEESDPEIIVRISGDCPLIDPTVVDKAIDIFRNEYPKWDYVSNTQERTYPRGLDVEVFSREALQRTFELARRQSEREHVTPYIYGHPQQFKLKNFKSPGDLSSMRWTVDTTEDFELIRLIFEELYPKNVEFTTEDVLQLLKKHPDWLRINVEVRQKSLDLGTLSPDP